MMTLKKHTIIFLCALLGLLLISHLIAAIHDHRFAQWQIAVYQRMAHEYLPPKVASVSLNKSIQRERLNKAHKLLSNDQIDSEVVIIWSTVEKKEGEECAIWTIAYIDEIPQVAVIGFIGTSHVDGKPLLIQVDDSMYVGGYVEYGFKVKPDVGLDANEADCDTEFFSIPRTAFDSLLQNSGNIALHDRSGRILDSIAIGEITE